MANTASAATSPPTSIASSVADGAPNTSELIGLPSAFWSPVGVGRTRIGHATSARPPPARNASRPNAHVAGRTSVTTNAPLIVAPQRSRRSGAPPPTAPSSGRAAAGSAVTAAGLPPSVG